jgi:hypothetical protein
MKLIATLALLAVAAQAETDDDILADIQREAEESADDHDSATQEDAPDYDPEHPLTDMPEAAPMVEVSRAHFTQHADKKFPIGSQVDVMFAMTNNGDAPYNVTAVMGSLNKVDNFYSYYRNFSRKQLNTVIAPSNNDENTKKINEYSFSYSFDTDKYSDAKDYLVALTVFYESKEETFSTTFFNSTVTLVNGDSNFDVASIIQFFSTVFIAVFITYKLLSNCGGGKKGGKRGKSARVKKTSAGGSSSVLQTVDTSKGKSVAKSRKSKKKKKSKK